MNLVIDVGNTNTKIAVFKDNVIVLKRIDQSFDIQKTILEIGCLLYTSDAADD